MRLSSWRTGIEAIKLMTRRFFRLPQHACRVALLGRHHAGVRGNVCAMACRYRKQNQYDSAHGVSAPISMNSALPSKPTKHNTCEQTHQSGVSKPNKVELDDIKRNRAPQGVRHRGGARNPERQAPAWKFDRLKASRRARSGRGALGGIVRVRGA